MRKNRKKKKQGRVRYDAQMVSVDVSLYGTTERERAKTPPFSSQGQEFSLPYTLTDNSLYGTEGWVYVLYNDVEMCLLLLYLLIITTVVMIYLQTGCFSKNLPVNMP